MHRYRSHTCGALRASDIDREVRLSGWCHRIRDHGGVLFIDLRDHYGLTQVVALKLGGYHTMLGVPLLREGNVVGVFGLAPSAEICESVGTEIARFCCSRSTARTSDGGTTIQPTRHPVMQKYLENELTMMTSGEIRAAHSAAKA